MAGKGSPSNILMFVGGIFSFFYILFGALMIMGKITLFDLEPVNRKLLGAAVLAYGVFRLYLFFRRYKQMREE
ncbi:MAG: hypothetical protein ACLQQ4_13325 [Bacteroidia bacterium]|jgi:hypothetical protein